MDNNFELVICIDKEAKTKEILITGPIQQIDKYTIKFEEGNQIKKRYQTKVQKFYQDNKQHIQTITKKTGRAETGDIALIGTLNKEIKRIKVLYRKHIKVFETVILYKDFEQYLKNNYYKEYCEIQIYKHKEIELLELTEETSLIIRRIYDIYKLYSKEFNQPSPTKIYSEIKKQENKPEDITKLEAYEMIFMDERMENQKYDIREKKGKQKTLRGK